MHNKALAAPTHRLKPVLPIRLLTVLDEVGRAPSPAPDPWSGLSLTAAQADEGVGCGPAGPRHSLRRNLESLLEAEANIGK